MDNLEANIMDKSMRSVFVGNIPYEATEEKLKDIFGEVGQVLSFKLVFDRETGKPKGYGFCEYRDQETALSAMRNLNGYEIGGRNLRVDNACTEKSRMEMQNLLNQPPVENPYGEPIQAEKAPEAISKAVASLPPEQMFELMKQMKLCIQNNPTEARQMLLQNPQLSYALLQAQVVMKIIDPHTAATLLHPPNAVPSTLASKEKAPQVPISINSAFAIAPVPVQAPRNDFQPVPAPVISQNHQNSAFSGNIPHSKDKRISMLLPTLPSEPAIPQDPSAYLSRHSVDRAPLNLHQETQRGAAQDVDLRSLDPRGGGPDPRLRVMGDQDMRTLPGQLPNPLPPTIAENFPKQDKGESFSRDPRAGTFPTDPRQQQRIDPRQKNIPAQASAMPLPPQPVRPPQPQVPPAPQRPVSIGNAAPPNLGQAGASDQEKAALIMQVLQLSDEQIAMLPPEQRNSILVLKEQIAKSAHR